jgi:hypothetical protein
MFRLSSEEQYGEKSQSGVRHLFSLGPFAFQDTLDAEEGLHHFLLEGGESPDGTVVYEVDEATMYEFMARFLAGEFEKREYQLERSPGHEALLDLLEIASARARGGETDFTVDELDEGVDEIIDEESVEFYESQDEEDEDHDTGGTAEPDRTR